MISAKFKKVLIINIFGVGDVLFTTPLISNLKVQYPNLFIGYISNRRTSSVITTNPLVDRSYIYERDYYHRIFKKSKIQFFREMFAFLGEIKKEKYDVFLDLSLNGSASFLMWLIGIRERIGYNFRNRSFYLNKKINFKGYEGKHVVEHYLDLLRILGVEIQKRNLELYLTDDEKSWAEMILKKNNLQAKKFVVMMPGGGASWGKDASLKRWPSQDFAKLADKIVEKLNTPIILMGGENEVDLCEKVASSVEHKVVNLAGQTSIGQMAALLKDAKLAVLNDGGPLHVATAVGAQTVSIFGPVDEKVYGPYPETQRHRVVFKDLPCRPCYRRFKRADCEHLSCLKLISVDDVFRKVEELV